MASKWAKLKGKLEPFIEEPSYQEKVDEEKSQFIALSPVELARQFKMAKDQKDEHEAMISDINVRLKALSQLIVSALEGAGMEALELPSGMKVGLEEKVYIGVLDTPEGRAAYQKWENGPKIKPLKKLYVATRDGFVREEVMKAMVLGKPVPKQFSDWVKLQYETRAKLTGRGKENSKEEE